jgi:hypothetical protein
MRIATLIPAYKTAYIVDLLNSLRLQTSRSDLIIISDDSPHGEFREVLYSAPYKQLLSGLEIEFHEGPRSGAYENMKHLVKLWAGRSDLMHMMLDDDVMYPEFYERHRFAHASGNFSCSVSRRWTANEAGFPVQGQPVPDAIARNPSRMISLPADVIFMTTVAECKNYFGEFSNSVFRADCVDLLLDPKLGDVSYAGLWDLGAFVAASIRRPLCHIQDHLGYFRISPGQNSSNLNNSFMKGAHLGFIALAVGGRRIGQLAPELARKCYGIMLPALMQRYASQPDMQPFCALLPALAAGEEGSEERFIEAWNDFLATHGF